MSFLGYSEHQPVTGAIMSEQPESWHEARLIPTSGIAGSEEQERRATSALLAVMSVVKEFGRALLKPLGAPAGTIETFIEVPFEVNGAKCFPDGLILVRRGQRTWTALVEVKTGRNVLQAEQLETYLDVAKSQGFDALITISNEIPPMIGEHPTKVDKRKTRKVEMHHWSWTLVLSTAVLQKEHRGVSDPEQAWILGELIRYLEHPRSGAMELEDMGTHWVTVRNAVTSGTLRPGDSGASEVVARFDGLLRYLSLRLGRQLGTDVVQVRSRKEALDPSLRAQSVLASLVSEGRLSGAIRIPDTVGPIHIAADLRANQISCYLEVDAPNTGRAVTRVNWLLRQLKHAPENTRIEAFMANSRGPGTAELLGKAREDSTSLVADPKKDIRRFQITMIAPMGTKKARGKGSFIDSVVDMVDDFYSDVVQHIKKSTPRPPQLREVEPETVQPPEIASVALSSQDGPDFEASNPAAAGGE
ncbi:hypothetical protein ACWIDS_14055 [Dietzia maris]